MPVPVWACSDLGLLDEPLDTATMVSEDIWKKFDLDSPLDRVDAPLDTYYGEQRSFDDGVLPDLFYDSMSCHESREIRHHDCMWAGLCISKEHNRTLPAKKDSQVQKKVPAGRSLLISRAGATQSATSFAAGQHQATAHYTQQQQHLYHQRMKSLESDGDSTRPDTPRSSGSDTETEDEAPVFRHDQISIHEKLSECMSEAAAATKAAPVSEVTGQLARQQLRQQQQFHERRKEELQQPIKQEQGQCQVPKETNIRNTLSDHCYHLNQPITKNHNQPIGKNLEHLGVQTPSDSEEEIDVVTFEKPCRPAVLPTYPSPADQQHFQLTVNTAFKEKNSNSSSSSSSSCSAPPTPPTPRPRGRPPSNPAARKRSGPQAVEQRPAKRPRHRSYQRRGKVARCVATSPTSMKLVTTSTSRSSSDDELDTEKRSLHNNMERQRRIELRNAFEELRVKVPAVETKEKAPKVAILRQAAVYCDMLTEMSQVNEGLVLKLKRRQERLRARLSQLRRSLAMTR